MRNLHFVPFALDSFPIMLEIAAVDDFEMGLGVSIVLSCRSNQGWRSVDAIDSSHGRGEKGGKFPVTAAHIEDSVLGLRVEILQHLLGKFRDERGGC